MIDGRRSSGFDGVRLRLDLDGSASRFPGLRMLRPNAFEPLDSIPGSGIVQLALSASVLIEEWMPWWRLRCDRDASLEGRQLQITNFDWPSRHLWASRMRFNAQGSANFPLLYWEFIWGGITDSSVGNYLQAHSIGRRSALRYLTIKKSPKRLNFRGILIFLNAIGLFYHSTWFLNIFAHGLITRSFGCFDTSMIHFLSQSVFTCIIQEVWSSKKRFFPQRILR